MVHIDECVRISQLESQLSRSRQSDDDKVDIENVNVSEPTWIVLVTGHRGGVSRPGHVWWPLTAVEVISSVCAV